MKTPLVLILAMALVGCESSRQRASLTPEQASAIAMRLANDKATTLYQRQPFADGQPAQLKNGRWVWTDTRGFGRLDFQARVELAANGSTNSVDIRLLESQDLSSPMNSGVGGRGGGF